MRTPAIALSGLLVAACSCDALRAPEPQGCAEPSMPPASAVPSVSAPPDAPWAIRIHRRCSEWAYSELVVSDRHAFTCPGAVHDRATGELVRADPRGAMLRPLAVAGSRTLWEERSHDEGALSVVIRDADLSEARLPLASEPSSAGARPGADEVAIATETGVSVVDLARRSIRDREDGARCARATAIALRASGSIECLVADGPRTIWRHGDGTEQELAASISEPRFDRAGERVVAVRGGSLELVSGSETSTRAIGAPFSILDVAADGRVLAAIGGRIAIVHSDGAVETVLDERVEDHGGDRASFAGDQIIVERNHDVLWIARGPRTERPAIEIAPPPGLVALEPLIDGDWPAWGRGEARYGRARDEVAAFERGGDEGWAHVTVALLDRAELARFEGEDATWGRALLERIVDPGTERTGHVYRDAQGRRSFRGHVWIGGCERTHIDTLIRERDEHALELWTMHTGEREAVDEVLGAIPQGARVIPSELEDRYAGDPSTGTIGP